eukprot:SAG31_NODE_17487_length_668_cov_11.107206_1_plen_24_part_10
MFANVRSRTATKCSVCVQIDVLDQ